MKKTLLGLALSCVAGIALADDHDDRWMLSPSLIFNAFICVSGPDQSVTKRAISA